MCIIKRKKKGMTLLEVIISIAILGIMIVPLSNMILTSVRTNKNGEDKQQAVYLAQQTIESLKNVTSFSNAQINLNNGEGILQINAAGTSGTATVGDFTINTQIDNNPTITYENTQTDSNTYDATITFKNSNTIDFNYNEVENRNFDPSTDDMYLMISDSNIGLFTDSAFSQSIISRTKAIVGTFGNKLLINFVSGYANTHNINIHVTNRRTTDGLKIYAKVPSGVVCNITNELGDVTTYNIAAGDATKFVSNYTASISVTKNGKELYNIQSKINK